MSRLLTKATLASTALLIVLLLGCGSEASLDGVLFSSQVTWFGTSPQGPIPIRTPREYPNPSWRFWTAATAPSALIGATVDGSARAWVGLTNAGVWRFEEGQAGLVITPLSQAGLLKGYILNRFVQLADRIYLHLYHEPDDPTAQPTSASLAWFKPNQTELILLPLASQINNPNWQAVRLDAGPQPGQARLSWKAFQKGVSTFTTTVYDFAKAQEFTYAGPQPALNGNWQALSDLTKNQPGLEDLLNLARQTAPAGTQLILHNQSREDFTDNLALAQSGSVGRWDLHFRGRSDRLGLLSADGHLFVLHPNQDRKTIRLPDLGLYGVYTDCVWLEHGLLLSWELRKGPFTGPSGLLYVPIRLLQ